VTGSWSSRSGRTKRGDSEHAGHPGRRLAGYPLLLARRSWVPLGPLHTREPAQGRTTGLRRGGHLPPGRTAPDSLLGFLHSSGQWPGQTPALNSTLPPNVVRVSRSRATHSLGSHIWSQMHKPVTSTTLGVGEGVEDTEQPEKCGPGTNRRAAAACVGEALSGPR